MVFKPTCLFVIAVATATLCWVSASGQPRGKVNCVELTMTALEELPLLYRDGKRTQVDSVLNAWEYACGRNEYSQRLRLLLLLEDKRFSSSNFDYRNYQYMCEYLADRKFNALMDSVHENPRELYLSYYGEPDLIFSFEQFTMSLARELMGSYVDKPDCSIEKMILNAYGDHQKKFFRELTSSSCNAMPSLLYRSQLKSVEKKALVNAAFFTGIWTPYGDLQLVGVHPLIGFAFGFGKGRMIYDMSFEFRFVDSKNSYSTVYKGSTIQTTHYFGGFAGVQTGYEIAQRKHERLYILGGVGWDGFDVVESDPQQQIEGKSINSLNMKAGLGWRHFSQDGAFVGIDVLHNFVNYKNTGGTSLAGNAFSIRLSLGLLKNDKRERELRYLKNLTRQ